MWKSHPGYLVSMMWSGTFLTTYHNGAVFSRLSGKRDPQPLIISSSKQVFPQGSPKGPIQHWKIPYQQLSWKQCYSARTEKTSMHAYPQCFFLQLLWNTIFPCFLSYIWCTLWGNHELLCANIIAFTVIFVCRKDSWLVILEEMPLI